MRKKSIPVALQERKKHEVYCCGTAMMMKRRKRSMHLFFAITHTYRHTYKKKKQPRTVLKHI